MALILDSYDAIYGTGRYGSARYGVVSPIWTVDGQRLTSAIGTVEVQVVEKLGSVRATLSLGTPTYTGIANKTLASSRLNVTLGNSTASAAANIEAEPNVIYSNTSDSGFEAKANQVAEAVTATITLGTISAKSINRVPVDGVRLTTNSGTIEVTLRTFVSGVRASSAVGTVKVNLSKVVAYVRATLTTNAPTTKAKANTVLVSTRSSVTLGSIKKQLNTKPVGARATVTANTVSRSGDANKTVTHSRITSSTKPSTATGTAFNFSGFATNYSPRRTIYIARAA